MKSFTSLLIALALSVSVSPIGAHAADNASSTGADTSVPQVMTEGEVRKVDKDAGKITIKHGEIKNLDMPAMTMVFRVKDPAMLDEVKAGDKIKFAADNVNGSLTVVKLAPVR